MTFIYVHVEKINLSYCLYVHFYFSKKMNFLDLMFNPIELLYILSIINIQRDLWELKIVDKVSFIKISQNVTKFLLFKLALEYRYTDVITLVSLSSVQISSVQLLSCVRLFATL